MIPAVVFIVLFVLFVVEAAVIWADQVILAERRERAYWTGVRAEVDAELIDWEREGWA